MLFAGLSLSLTAQNTTLAKINFEAAEEAYNSSNYELALEKLTKAEEFFGQINLPILYLRVINQDRLLTQKPNFTLLQELKSNCASFLSKYSNDTEAFEKIKEVYNIDEKWKTIKTETDFENYLKEFKVKQKREEIMALAKEITVDYQSLYKSTNSDIGIGKIEFLIDFDKKEYAIIKKDEKAIYFKAHLQDIKEIEVTNKNIKIYHNNRTESYYKMEYITTAYAKELKDKLLQLINLLKTVE